MATPLVATGPHLTIGHRRIPVVLPNRKDPRLRLSAVIISLQVLGQTVLDFKVSIAQILVSIGICAVVDTAVTYRRQKILAWPASALLTGNSVAFILRASGTQHGDWWSLNGIEFFVMAALLSLLSKYIVRPDGRHRFNPSNVGLVWTLLIIGPSHVFPQYLWWGPLDTPVVLALAVILLGGVWVLSSVKMMPMAVSFMVPFAVLVGLFAASGREFVAIWHRGPIEGLSYWANITLSPEVLIFVFFMMSDPATAPRSPRGRMIYGAATATLAAALLYFQPTEFGIKLSILASLTATCAISPLLERIGRRLDARGRESDGTAQQPVRARTRAWTRVTTPAVAAVAIIAVGAVVDTVLLHDNQEIILIERGLTGPTSPQ